MKRFAAHLLGAVITGCLLAALIIGGSALRVQHAQAGGVRFFQEAVTAIAQGWRVEALLERGTAEIQADEIRRRLPGILQSLAALGRLERLDEPTVRPITAEGDPKPAMPAYLVLAAPARFSKAAGTVHATLRREGSGWKILAFSIDSPLFQRPRTAPPPVPVPSLHRGAPAPLVRPLP